MSGPAPEDDEEARIKDMFQATSEHWEETQEKMAQSVTDTIPKRHVGWGLICVIYASATPIFSSRGGGFKRPLPLAQQHYYEAKPLPPGYICHRCNKKGLRFLD